MRLLALAVIVVVVFSVFSQMFANSPPNVQVKECSLASDSVQAGARTSIYLDIQSNDAQKAHSVRTELTSHQLVRFLIGSQELSQNGTIWYYEETLDSKAEHKNAIWVSPELESGVSKITYRINVVIYSDGVQIFSKNLDLIVQLP